MSNFCPICFNDFPDNSFYELLSCEHRCCKSCLSKHMQFGIYENQTLSCPVCPQPLHPQDVITILGPGELYNKYEEFALRRALLQDPDTRWCPAPDCGYAVIANNCAECPKLQCENPDCGKYFCYKCYSEWHEGEPCKSEDQRGIHIEDANPGSSSTELKKCPRCTVPILKESQTCNMMNCSMCKLKFCWLCLQPASYMHFFDRNTKCSLYSENYQPISNRELLLCEFGVLLLAPFVILLLTAIIASILLLYMPCLICNHLRKRYNSFQMGCCRISFAVFAGVIIFILVTLLLLPFLVVVLIPPLLICIYVIGIILILSTFIDILCNCCCRKAVNVDVEVRAVPPDPAADPPPSPMPDFNSSKGTERDSPEKIIIVVDESGQATKDNTSS